MTIEIFDPRPCALGEGAFWHPMRQQLFWFDILGKTLMTQGAAWGFDRMVSAAGWVDEDRLLIATQMDLTLFDLRSGASQTLVELEAENAATRSNDGRADPRGGFWIGTMGVGGEPGAGALYRFYRGEVHRIRTGLSIPNAICFSPDGSHAHVADTAEHLVWRYDLDADGWPVGSPEIYLDHRESGLKPDGAVMDATGRLWCAEWGASRVACYGPDGALLDKIDLPTPHPTCPALGAGHLYITTARQGLSDAALDAAPLSGQTLRVPVKAQGQAEHRVIL